MNKHFVVGPETTRPANKLRTSDAAAVHVANDLSNYSDHQAANHPRNPYQNNAPNQAAYAIASPGNHGAGNLEMPTPKQTSAYNRSNVANAQMSYFGASESMMSSKYAQHTNITAAVMRRRQDRQVRNFKYLYEE